MPTNGGKSTIQATSGAAKSSRNSLRPETDGINLFAEYSLHDALKRRAAGIGGRIEVAVDGKIADAVREDGEIVEIQTRGLSSIQGKVSGWVASGYRVRVQFPLAVRMTIVKIDGKTGKLLSRRKSPKRREIWDLLDELPRAPAIISTEGLVFEVLFIEMTEYRRQLEEPVRRGRFLRSVATVDRCLEAVLESREFRRREDWLALLPESADGSWTSITLGEALGVSAPRARKLLYSLSRAGLLVPAPTEGRRKRYMAGSVS
jgi:hypothetical protein